jgi:hypothetical protein
MALRQKKTDEQRAQESAAKERARLEKEERRQREQLEQQERRRRERIKAAWQAFMATPVGQARAAFENGDHVRPTERRSRGSGAARSRSRPRT